MLSYKIYGKGYPILLIHGFGISYQIWRRVVPALKKYYKLVIIEMPGIGKSPDPETDKNYFLHAANKIESLRQKLNIKSWSIVSYSIGAATAKNYLDKHSDCVDKAVFIFPPLLSNFKKFLLKLYLFIDSKEPVFGRVLLTGWRLKWLVIMLGFNGRRVRESQNWDRWIKSQKVAHLKLSLSQFAFLQKSDFCNINVPTLYIWGSRDLIVKKQKGLLDEVVIDTKHDGIVSDYKEVARIIKKFI